VKEGYIIEFVVEYNDSFSEAERKFVEGPGKGFARRNLVVDQDVVHGERVDAHGADRMVE
jgi:hypothetical protein